MADLFAIIDLIVLSLSSGIALSTPYLFASLGEVVAERSGILNLGLEGMMLIGAFSAFAVSLTTQSNLMGLLAAVAVGGGLGLMMGVLVIKLKANQIAVGLAIVVFGMGSTTFLNILLFGGASPNAALFEKISIPVIKDIPIIGTLLRQNILTFFALLLVPVFSIFLYRTTWGLKIRAIGENPRAADTLGINVFRMRYFAIILGGVLAALGGAYLTLGFLSIFMSGMTAGMGWTAIIVTILGKWDPKGALGGSILFGFVTDLTIRIQSSGMPIPLTLLNTLPYVVSLVVLVVIYGRRQPPAALMEPYHKTK